MLEVTENRYCKNHRLPENTNFSKFTIAKCNFAENRKMIRVLQNFFFFNLQSGMSLYYWGMKWHLNLLHRSDCESVSVVYEIVLFEINLRDREPWPRGRVPGAEQIFSGVSGQRIRRAPCVASLSLLDWDPTSKRSNIAGHLCQCWYIGLSSRLPAVSSADFLRSLCILYFPSEDVSFLLPFDFARHKNLPLQKSMVTTSNLGWDSFILFSIKQ